VARINLLGGRVQHKRLTMCWWYDASTPLPTRVANGILSLLSGSIGVVERIPVARVSNSISPDWSRTQ
jgi:hypothetical protein